MGGCGGWGGVEDYVSSFLASTSVLCASVPAVVIGGGGVLGEEHFGRRGIRF